MCVCVCVCVLWTDVCMPMYVCTLIFKDISQMARNLSQIVSLPFKYFLSNRTVVNASRFIKHYLSFVSMIDS